MLPCATVLAVPPDAATYRASGLDAMGRAARQWHHRRCNQPMERPMPQPNDLSRSLVTLEQDSTLIAVIGPVELAGRRDRAGNRTPASEEARGRPGWTVAASASLAEGSRAGWTPDQADRRRL